MKSISTQLSAHLDQEVTTLASCWKVVRRDGVEFFFTDHDQNLVFEGDTYEAAASYDRTAVAGGSDMSVDNMEVAGILDSERLDEQDMRNGLFNRADVYVFIVNWMDLTQGALKVRRGWFGEVTITDTGQFTTEIRGLAQALSHNFIEVYSAECRADFCDSRCKLNIADFSNRATVSDRGDGRSEFSGSDIPAAPTVGTSVGAHRWWSIKPTGYPAGTQFFMAEARFRDQSGNLISGGHPYDNVAGSTNLLQALGLEKRSSSNPKWLRDGSFNTSWGFSTTYNDLNGPNDPDIDIADVRWWIDFGTPVDIAQIEIIATNTPGDAPTAFDLQYIDTTPTNGSVWTTAKACSFVWTVGGQSATWAIGSTDESPINYTGTSSDLPAPSSGVSTYVGGTITWISGKNAGRTVEILGFDGATNTVTMFEGMAYSIEIGDLFDIAQGCDKSLARCKLYDNVINRRAEDYVPGNDELMQYPDAKQ